jgi:hypothetical protein
MNDLDHANTTTPETTPEPATPSTDHATETAFSSLAQQGQPDTPQATDANAPAPSSTPAANLPSSLTVHAKFEANADTGFARAWLTLDPIDGVTAAQVTAQLTDETAINDAITVGKKEAAAAREAANIGTDVLPDPDRDSVLKDDGGRMHASGDPFQGVGVWDIQPGHTLLWRLECAGANPGQKIVYEGTYPYKGQEKSPIDFSATQTNAAPTTQATANSNG